MADLRYTVDVNTRDAVRSIEVLKGAIGGLAAAFTVREFVKFADDITNLRNKLLSLTPELDTVNRQFKALAAIAITARTPLEATSDLFFRIQRSAKALGISQREAAQITESVAKALSASGQSASEAAGPLLQLGQALQSGTFQGDELRSILEGLPQVSQALAAELGVTVGQLKKLGSEGQVSADVFVRAMRRAKDSIEEAFGRTTPTITQSLERLKTVSKLAFDEFEKNTNTGKTLGQMIEYITVVVYNSIRSIDAFIEKWGSTLLLIGQIIIAFTAFKTVASIASGIVRAIAGIGRAFSQVGMGVASVGEKLGSFGQGIASMLPYADKLSKFFYNMGRTLAPLVGALAGAVAAIYAWSGIGEIIDKIKALGDSNSEAARQVEDFRQAQSGIKDDLDDTAGASENAAAMAKELAKQYARLQQASEFEIDNLNRALSQERARLALENKFTQLRIDGVGDTQDQLQVDQVRQRVAQDMYNAQQRLNQEIQKLGLEYNQLTVKDSQRGRELRQQIGVLQNQREENKKIYSDHEEGMAALITRQLNLKSIEEARKKINEDIIAAIDRQRQQQELAGQAVQDINRQISDLQNKRPEFATLGFTGIQKQLLQIEDDAKRAAQNAAEKFAREFGDVTPLNEAEFAAGLDAIAEGYKQLADLQKEFAQQNYTITRTFSYGWRDAMTRFVEDATNSAQYAKTLFDTFTRGFGDAIVRFVQTGKLSFKDLANSILADVARMASNRLLVSLFGKFFGGGFGTGMGFGNLDFGGFFAHGGRLGAGKWGVAGEAGPELVTGPANITPMTGGGVTNVTYNIQAVDASSFRTLVARDPEFIFNVTEQGRRSLPTRSRR